MGLATYRIGPSDLFLGEDLEADAATLDGQVTALDLASDGNENVSETLFESWDLWKLQFRAWKAQTFGGLLGDFGAALNNSNRDQLISYENQFLTFAGQFADAGVSMPGSLVQPSTGSKDGLIDHLSSALGFDSGSLVTVLVTLVVLYFVGGYVGKKIVG